jgi:hypothetical protein
MQSAELTEDDLIAMGARCEGATPGPWYVRFLDDAHFANLVAVSTLPDSGKGEALSPTSNERVPPIARELVAATLVQNPVHYVDIADARWDENAAFIAAARQDVPRLIAEVRRLRGLLPTPT